MEELELLIRQSVCSVVADIIVCKLLLLVDLFERRLLSSQLPLALPVCDGLFPIVALSGVVSLSKILKSCHIPGLMLVIEIS